MKSFTGIFRGLWSKGPSCNFTEQLFFLHSCDWLYLFNKRDQKIWQGINQMITRQNLEEKLKQLAL